MFCSHCGKELADNALMCPNCGSPTANMLNSLGKRAVRKATTTQTPTEKNPATIAGFVLSSISFVLGFILITCIFAIEGTGAFLDKSPFIAIFVLVPAFGGTALDIFGLVHKNTHGVSKFLSILGMVFAGIAIFYYFLGLCLSFAKA